MNEVQNGSDREFDKKENCQKILKKRDRQRDTLKKKPFKAK